MKRHPWPGVRSTQSWGQSKPGWAEAGSCGFFAIADPARPITPPQFPAAAGEYVKRGSRAHRMTVGRGRWNGSARAAGRSRKNFFGHKFRPGRGLPRAPDIFGFCSHGGTAFAICLNCGCHRSAGTPAHLCPARPQVRRVRRTCGARHPVWRDEAPARSCFENRIAPKPGIPNDDQRAKKGARYPLEGLIFGTVFEKKRKNNDKE
jgi:hypothetical protein